MRNWLVACALVLPAVSVYAETNAELAERVRQTEIAFARTMADRDHAAFVSFLAEETIFVYGGRSLRGRTAVAEAWKRYYEGATPPFSWQPEEVEVLDSGTLALTSGPVKDPSGQRVGTFNSVWRREADGKWKIVLDNGCPPCSCPSPAPSRLNRKFEKEAPGSRAVEMVGPHYLFLARPDEVARLVWEE